MDPKWRGEYASRVEMSIRRPVPGVFHVLVSFGVEGGRPSTSFELTLA